MISVTRLNGQRFAVNQDLIEQVREIPDTTLVLVDGTTYNITETYDQVSDLIDLAHARVLAAAYNLRAGTAEVIHTETTVAPGAPIRKGGLL
ncbi:flagellar FlbD family protein [Leifsonia sp. Leaf264]|uniref:flagellar FlbD family protein n=1 Tax=Leifsonia sp. Leaf264 TaxID=1736314 RepID=UPI0006F9A2BD|nr:flagellar FlbD family protein [Leifsonia sp. Leaf264]KQO98241.1 hypothetical protein ASF30_09270 [Leifsonia sp. Leaf264]